MVVQCFMTSGIVAAEGAESGVYVSLISMPINGDALCSGHPVHGRLGHQIMETKVSGHLCELSLASP